MRVWPTAKLDTRRMFVRDGMAYVRIPHRGDWKLDLQGCEVVDEGRILGKVMQVEAFERSLAAKVKALLG